MRIVIVGAGTAGCVLAARLSESFDHEVVLFEAGPNSDHRLARGADFMAACESPDLTWPGSTLRGRGVGGTSQINGMVAMLGLPSDYDDWGIAGWSWADLLPAVERIAVPTRVCPASELSVVDEALIEACGGAPLAGPAQLVWDGHQRSSVVENYLRPALGRSNVVVRCDEVVRAVSHRNGRAQSVVLSSGQAVHADHVVVCSGSIGSPEILATSGVPFNAVAPIDHASVTRDFRLARPHTGALLCAAIAHSDEERTLQALPMARASAGSITVGSFVRSVDGASVGSASVDAASAWLTQLVDHPAVRSIGIDFGAEQPGGYTHRAGTVPLGRCLDETAQVIGLKGLRVCDASIFPTLPRANPMMSVILVAEHLAAIFHQIVS